ncbi:serine protease [Serendipita sp. 396]|nr:serine protease [Serendipita sp. 396]
MFLRSLTLTAFGIQHVFSTPLSTAPFLGSRQQSTMPLAPVVAPSTPHLINNSYIIMLRPDVDSQAMLMHFDFLESAHAEDPLDAEGEGGIKHVYDGPRSKGYAGSFSDKTVERIRAQPEVDYIEMDQVVWASSMDTQKGAPWVRNLPIQSRIRPQH